MGGDSLLAQPINNTAASGCGTITLGGLETTTGVSGFVIAAHVVAGTVAFGDTPADYTKTDVLIAHSELKPSFKMKHFLGKVFRMPTFRTEGDKKILSVDAAFVAYPSPKTPGCSLTWTSDTEEFCLDPDQDEHIERVVPLSVRGEDNRVYTVVGSKEPTDGLAVRISGVVTGTPLKGTVTGGRFLQGVGGKDHYEYSYASVGDTSTAGNSGAPVYTVPNAAGNVHVVGILTGYFYTSDGRASSFGSWSDVTQGLSLKPVGQ